MEEDRLSLFLRERVELELPEQRPPHFSPSLSSETSKQRGAVLLVFSEELNTVSCVPACVTSDGPGCFNRNSLFRGREELPGW